MWEISITDQLLSFVLSIALGAFLCLTYDVLRAVRKNGFNSFWTVFFTDIFFWLFSAILTFLLLIARTNGEIRGYVLIGELLGFVIFRLLLSKVFLLIIDFLIAKLLKLLRLIRKNFYYFFIKIEKRIDKIILLFCKKTKTMLKIVKKLLKNSAKLLYIKRNNVNVESADERQASTESKTVTIKE